MADNEIPTTIAPVERPRQFDQPVFSHLPEVDSFLWVSQARQAFGVSGAGQAVAVLDTGLNAAHVDFAGRVAAQVNFTADNGGDANNAADGNGHGTNVAGIIAANGDHKGVATGAGVIPIKVLANSGGGSFASVRAALEWVRDNRETHGISAVCMSLGDSGNYNSDSHLENDPIRAVIRELRDARVPVVIAAGNGYFQHNSQQGMSYPAIIRECISVGAVYDAEEGSFSYGSGATAFSSRAGQITPFSQRLHKSLNRHTKTDVFAPGAPVTSSGINGPHGESVQHGTSQATPVTVGVILLLQEFHQRITGERPAVDDVLTWLLRGSVQILDGDDEDDNVAHTNKSYARIDALSALDAARRALYKKLLGDGPAPVG